METMVKWSSVRTYIRYLAALHEQCLYLHHDIMNACVNECAGRMSCLPAWPPSTAPQSVFCAINNPHGSLVRLVLLGPSPPPPLFHLFLFLGL
ncbi:unnamed protein product [Periconia digitata]|uniref:Uncharacterized protein n=1 Tax=Periconia digitata TaxID=1303443 RepID=A0A9W4UDG8_9PLEO|nr:unnamed protein product [Periconia digitata]